MKALSALALSLLATLSWAAEVPGSLPGDFRVNEMGAATYAIPLELPPAVAGMQPRLSLVYNSQAGNGMLGAGWSLGGLSAISRCPRTLAQDGVRGAVNYDGNDRFCLDGQRLMVISGAYGADGSEYRTELDSFSKIVAHGGAGNGPAWFEVWSKDGLRSEYGNTGDSRIEAQGKPTVSVWAINRQQDRKGNYIQYGYLEDTANGGFLPATVSYGGNQSTGHSADGLVQFDYEGRPDVVAYYRAGSRTSLSQRMSRIRSSYAGVATYDYRLSYLGGTDIQRSRLQTIQQCQGDDCKKPLTLSWTSTDTVSFDIKPPSALLKERYSAGDLDGDGRAELVQQDGLIAGSPGIRRSWQTWTVQGDGRILERGSGDFEARKENPNCTKECSFKSPVIYGTDRDRDGRTEVVDLNDYYALPAASLSTSPATYLLDLNGDGLQELVRLDYSEGENSSGHPIGGACNMTANGVVTQPGSLIQGNARTMCEGLLAKGDFNGDGNLDIVLRGQNGPALLAGDGAGNWRLIGQPVDRAIITEGDFNGDGLTDLLMDYRLWLSKGDGSGETLDMGPVFPNGYSWDGTKYVADLNGDGLDDIVLVRNDARTVHAWLSRGDGRFRFLNVDVGGNLVGSMITGDFNGDGRIDLIRSGTGPTMPPGSGTVPSSVWFTGPVNIPDAVIRFDNGQGVAQQVSYSSLAYRGCNRGSSPGYPLIASCSALYVVDQVDRQTASGTASARYDYGGLLSHREGRGLLGFQWISSTDLTTGLKTRQEYNQLWPLTGTLSREQRLAGGGQVLSDRQASYLQQDLGGRLFVAEKSSSLTRKDLNGATLPSVTTSNRYDCEAGGTCYGNLLQATEQSSDGFSKTVTTSYLNRADVWLIGRPLRSQVQNTAPDPQIVTPPGGDTRVFLVSEYQNKRLDSSNSTGQGYSKGGILRWARADQNYQVSGNWQEIDLGGAADQPASGDPDAGLKCLRDRSQPGCPVLAKDLRTLISEQGASGLQLRYLRPRQMAVDANNAPRLRYDLSSRSLVYQGCNKPTYRSVGGVTYQLMERTDRYQLSQGAGELRMSVIDTRTDEVSSTAQGFDISKVLEFAQGSQLKQGATLFADPLQGQALVDKASRNVGAWPALALTQNTDLYFRSTGAVRDNTTVGALARCEDGQLSFVAGFGRDGDRNRFALPQFARFTAGVAGSSTFSTKEDQQWGACPNVAYYNGGNQITINGVTNSGSCSFVDLLNTHYRSVMTPANRCPSGGTFQVRRQCNDRGNICSNVEGCWASVYRCSGKGGDRVCGYEDVQYPVSPAAFTVQW